MKHTAKVALFICLQLVIAGLAFLAGWNSGNPADRERLKRFELDLEFGNHCLTVMRSDRLGSFQSLVESLQLTGDITNAVTKLSRLIDHEIGNSSGWMEYGSNVSGLQWPNGEKEFKVLLRIAEYRLNHPVDYKYPPDYRDKTPRILKEVLQCRDRRKADPKWVPPQTDGETLILQP